MVKLANKLYIDLLGHKPKDRLSLHAALHSLAAHVRPSLNKVCKEFTLDQACISSLIKMQTV